MRWIAATARDDGRTIWINMAAGFTISREKDDCGEFTQIQSVDGQLAFVREEPEHLVAPFR